MNPTPLRKPQSKTSGSAIVLICDQNYLLPTFSTALSADRHTAANDVPVIIFVVNSDSGWTRQFDSAVAGTKIRIVAADLPQLKQAASFHRDRYLPPIALARFWIDGLLEHNIDRFLYVDGDTMVDGELDSLLSVRPPPGKIMAAPDVIRLFMDELSRGIKHDLAYLEGLNCDADSYFNSGVIYASRDAWKSIVPKALDFLAEHPELCRSSDQSALNHAARGRVEMLPLTYNYQSDHMMVLDPRKNGFAPVIWHFTGGPKPWDQPGWPWDEYFNRFYRMSLLLLKDCSVTTPKPPEAQLRAGISHRRRTKTRLTWVYPWRKITRKRKTLLLLSAGFP
ncbi:glycosyltransferase family 8 protein [Allomesorhizobium camelthorni]|uniref:Glycosyltransferase family 8 protein n=1 Tax=Allomesorhizobium camelthorni TaxID=475069 RepID=A0A6G4WE93_9HYPH|nr:glycosyltransferase family 8 protein [Mesorhizobium camelthorni]NGO52929.1 glycosyltransferase family 8 protein [Mesorhizobium camelthorni]